MGNVLLDKYPFSFEASKREFYDTAVADILRAYDGGSIIGAFTLSLLCVEYVGMGMDPEKMTNRSTKGFEDFINSYMKKVDPKYGSCVERLKKMRNVLSHSYGTLSSLDFNYRLIDRENRFSHLRVAILTNTKTKEKIGEGFYISVPLFIADLITAIEYFFRDIKENNESDSDKMRQWFSSRMMTMDFDGKPNTYVSLDNKILRTYKSMHRFLEILENSSAVYPEIRKFIAQKAGSKKCCFAI